MLREALRIMDFWLIIVLIVVGFIAMYFMLLNWMLSKICSEVLSIVSIVNSIFLVDNFNQSGDSGSIWIYVICTVLGWMFFMAAYVFETTYEGFSIDLNTGEISDILSGGFWGNFFGAVGVTLLTIFIGYGGEFYAIFYIVPIVLLIINTISMFIEK